MEVFRQYFLVTLIFTVLVYSGSCLGAFRYSAATADHRHYDLSPAIKPELGVVLLKSRRHLLNVNQLQNSARRSKGRRLTTPARYVVNVDQFGAKADGTDDTQAFMMAWKKACSTRQSIFLVPARKVYHLKQINFDGPCQSGITMRIQGSIRASTKRSDFEKDPRVWIKFENLLDFSVDGGGVISGNGQVWWPKSCKIDKTQPCVGAPTAVTFSKCTNLKVTHLKIKNAQQMHLTFHDCSNVEASNLKVKSKGTSPNTDGIHVTGSNDVRIINSDIGTGDDCISIVSGSYNVRAMGIKCGPGHGISIGSLGKDGAEDQVSNILVSGATFTGTSNGVRIKTWQGGRGFAKNMVFENIMMRNVTNPIIIDQFYCDKKGHDCTMQENSVHVENVLYKNIMGTSASNEGIVFQCSETFPCNGVKLQNVQLTHNGRSSLASCSNVNVQQYGRNTPQCPNIN